MPRGNVFYDSPTFLSQKDKYFLGLSLPQIMGCLGIAATVFIFSLMFPFSLIWRLAFCLPVTAGIAVLLYARVYGLPVPIFLLYTITFPFRTLIFEIQREAAVRGSSLWLQQLSLRETAAQRNADTGLKGLFSKGKTAAASEAAEEKRYQVQVEAEAKVAEGSRALERMARDGIKSMLKGS